MKIKVIIITILVILLNGCAIEKDVMAEAEMSNTSGLIVRASSEEMVSNGVEPIVFTGEHLLWFNESSKEFRFKDNSAMKSAFSNVNALNFYIDEEFLFSAFVRVNSPSSAILNSLVFYYNPTENKYYLLDGYPPEKLSQNVSDPPDIADAREDNWKLIAEEWKKFINQLKKDKKYSN